MIDLMNPDAVLAEAERRRRLREQGARTFDECNNNGIVIGEIPDDASNAHRIIDPIEYELDEKAIESACDQLAQKAGARVIRFSHPGKTRQTEGIADRLYCFPQHKIALWFECKTPRGTQRPGQVLFEEIVTASGQLYACGGIGDLRAWLITNLSIRAEEL